jgi:hypothetical protein
VRPLIRDLNGERGLVRAIQGATSRLCKRGSWSCDRPAVRRRSERRSCQVGPSLTAPRTEAHDRRTSMRETSAGPVALSAGVLIGRRRRIPVWVAFPKGSYVNSACSAPALSASASELPSTSVRRECVPPVSMTARCHPGRDRKRVARSALGPGQVLNGIATVAEEADLHAADGAARSSEGVKARSAWMPPDHQIGPTQAWSSFFATLSIVRRLDECYDILSVFLRQTREKYRR